MIWEGIPNGQSVARLQAMGIYSLVYDPGANTSQQGDFMIIMKNNISAFEKAYRSR